MEIIVNGLTIPLWPIGILALFGVGSILWRRKHNLPYLFFFAMFWVYVMSGLDKVFFPIQINGQFVDVMRQVPLMSQINLLPFYFQYGFTPASFIGIIDNIILTMPFGFGLNFISKIRMKDYIWLSIAVGLGIETIQFVITLILGYPYRVVDINDVLLNATGVLVGYYLFRAFSWLYLAMTRRFNIEHSGLSSYIYNIAYQEKTTGD